MTFWHGLIIGFVAFPVCWLVLCWVDDHLPDNDPFWRRGW